MNIQNQLKCLKSKKSSVMNPLEMKLVKNKCRNLSNTILIKLKE